MAEGAPRTTPNQYPFGAAPEIVGYSPGPDGKVQLAESYTVPGTPVQWEDHPFTTTDAQRSKTPERKAVITASAQGTGDQRVYYLKGDTLYDMQHLDDPSRQSAVTFAPGNHGRYRMYKVSIGEDAAFTEGLPVTEVLVATKKYGTRSAIAKQATPRGNDVFTIYDAIIEQAAQTERAPFSPASPRRHDAPYMGPSEPVYKEWSETWRKRDNRLGVTNQSPKLRQLDAEIELVRSREGVPISPQPLVKEFIVDRLKDDDENKGTAKDKEAIIYRRDVPHYEPRIVDGIMLDAKERLSETSLVRGVRRAILKRRHEKLVREEAEDNDHKMPRRF